MHFLLLVIFEIDITYGRERGQRTIVSKTKMFSVEPGAVVDSKNMNAMTENLLLNIFKEMSKENSQFRMISHSLTKL